MKLLLTIYNGPNRQLVPSLLERHEAGGYTEISQAHGTGETGPRRGNRAWPGDAAVVFSILPDDRAPGLIAALRDESANLTGDERLHVAVMPVETFF